MIGLIILFLVVQQFVKTAKQKGESPWKWGVLALVSYYGTQIAAVFLIAYLMGAGVLPLIGSDFLLGLTGIPFGILVCWLTYRVLMNIPEKRPEIDAFGQEDEDWTKERE